ncbi:MAG TPA: serine/threonine-protein kinase [Ornithinibacter sp.]|nr:serine/threonine-protein kinase [Ornithinibacter sp.]
MTADAIADGPGPEETRSRAAARLGEYRLVQRLGEGGMGVVHLGLDRHGRAVAVKVLRQHVAHDPEARARLHREVETLGRIRSPRVAPIVDADVDGHTPYIVTRYVPGPSLEEHVAERGLLPPTDLHRVASGLAEALDVIHSAGVVHRDVKPGNVLLVDGDPVLIDFGIAHIVDDIRLTLTGLVMGTPGYLAPEVVGGEDVTPATDWWGWAATTAYAASGTPPFGKGAMSAVLARVARGEPDLAAVDPRIEPLLYAALSPDPQDRPHHDEVTAALERYALGAPVTEAIQVRRERPSTQVLTTPPTAGLPLPPPPPPARSNGAGAAGAAGSTRAAGSGASAVVGAAGAGVVGGAGVAGGAGLAGAAGAALAAGGAVGTQAGAGSAVPPPGVSTGRPTGPRSWDRALPADRAAVQPGPAPPAGRPPGPPTAGRPVDRPNPASQPNHVVPAGRQGVGAAVPSTESDWDAARLGHGPYGDPRIGRPSRSGTLLALVALLAALTTRAPYLAVLVLLGWIALARTADRSVTSLVMRRHERGARGSDVAVAVASGPWHLVVGVIGAAVTVVLPIVVGVCAMFATALVLAAFTGDDLRPDGVMPLAVAGVFAALTAWWGPGGASLRRGSRSIVRGATPGARATQVALVVLLLAAAALLASATQTASSPTWWPSESGPGWIDATIPTF